jgi:hypothetical protein
MTLRVWIKRKAPAFVCRQLPAATTAQTNNPGMALFQTLPEQFDLAKYIEIAAQLQISESTADKQIARFLSTGLFTRQTHGSYTGRKCSHKFNINKTLILCIFCA